MKIYNSFFIKGVTMKNIDRIEKEIREIFSARLYDTLSINDKIDFDSIDERVASLKIENIASDDGVVVATVNGEREKFTTVAFMTSDEIEAVFKENMSSVDLAGLCENDVERLASKLVDNPVFDGVNEFQMFYSLTNINLKSYSRLKFEMEIRDGEDNPIIYITATDNGQVASEIHNQIYQNDKLCRSSVVIDQSIPRGLAEMLCDDLRLLKNGGELCVPFHRFATGSNAYKMSFAEIKTHLISKHPEIDYASLMMADADKLATRLSREGHFANANAIDISCCMYELKTNAGKGVRYKMDYMGNNFGANPQISVKVCADGDIASADDLYRQIGWWRCDKIYVEIDRNDPHRGFVEDLLDSAGFDVCDEYITRSPEEPHLFVIDINYNFDDDGV